MRFALLLSSFLVTACTVGAVGDTGSGDDMTGSNPPSGNGCQDKLTDPQVPAHMHIAGNTTNAGQNCMLGGCHLNSTPGAGAPGFAFAGTIFQPGGTTPSVGTAIRIKGGGKTLTTYSDLAGNFYLETATVMSSGMTFPGTVDASVCPTAPTAMVTTVDASAAATSSCNLCHTSAAGGSTTPITLNVAAQ
jgi:hypothetical protein